MKIPVTITVLIEVPDSVVKHFNEPVNNTPTIKPAPEVKANGKKRKFQRGVSVPDTERFGGISVTPKIAQVLKYVMEQGKTFASYDHGKNYSAYNRATEAELLNKTTLVVTDDKGSQRLRAQYELTDLGLDALAWYERTYE